MKKTICVIMSLLLALAAVPAVFSIETSAAWSGSRADGFAAGSGTEADPYLISSAEELAYLAFITNNGNVVGTEYYTLINDIDISGTNWEPIGIASGTPFRGVFDGNGYTISGLMCESSTSYGGLFGRIDGATVKNLNVTGTIVSSTNYAGAIIAYGVNSVKIINCTSDVQIVKGSAVGGIVGRVQGRGQSLEDNYIVGCISSSNIEVLPDQSNGFAGGIVGAVGAAIINYCGNTGNISIPHPVKTLGTAGGIVGVQGADNTTSHIFNCFNTGDISVVSTINTSYAGGIVGRAAHINDMLYLAAVKNCFSTGNVINKDPAGAVLDGKYGSVIGNIRYIADIENCYTSIPLSEYPEVGTDDYLMSVEDGDITVLSIDQMKGLSAVENMKLGPAWMANVNGLPTFDIEKALEVYTQDVATTAPDEETTAPSEEVTTEPSQETEGPVENEDTEDPSQTEAPAVTTEKVTENTPKQESGSKSDGGGVNIFLILIPVVVVGAGAAIAWVIISEKKKA